MQNLKILNKKEQKKILKEIESVYGVKIKLDFAFFRSSKDKIYLLSKKFGELIDENLRINNLGLYFGKLEKDGFRLSIEGAQMINAKKNIVELNVTEIEEWIRGVDLKKNTGLKGYVIIKHNNDVYGVGKQTQEKILNYVSKNRRIKSLTS